MLQPSEQKKQITNVRHLVVVLWSPLLQEALGEQNLHGSFAGKSVGCEYWQISQ